VIVILYLANNGILVENKY